MTREVVNMVIDQQTTVTRLFDSLSNNYIFLDSARIATKKTEIEYEIDNFYCPRCHQNEFIVNCSSSYAICNSAQCKEIHKKAFEKEKAEKLRRVRVESPFGKKYNNAFLNERIPKEVLECVKKFKDSFFFICGDVGCGKTYFCSAIHSEFIRKGKSVYAFHESDFYDKINTQNREFGSTSNLVQSISEADLLILDDFGSSKISDYRNETVFNIINKRYSNEKATLISSNKDLDELSEAFGDRIVSRIASGLNVRYKSNYQR